MKISVETLQMYFSMLNDINIIKKCVNILPTKDFLITSNIQSQNFNLRLQTSLKIYFSMNLLSFFISIMLGLKQIQKILQKHTPKQFNFIKTRAAVYRTMQPTSECRDRASTLPHSNI